MHPGVADPPGRVERTTRSDGVVGGCCAGRQLDDAPEDAGADEPDAGALEGDELDDGLDDDESVLEPFDDEPVDESDEPDEPDDDPEDEVDEPDAVDEFDEEPEVRLSVL